MRWVVGLIVALWLGGCSRTGLLVDDAGTDAGTDAGGLDAGCGQRPPYASLPPCDDPAFWALEPTRCFDSDGCANCETGPEQPFTPLCFAPVDAVRGRPSRIRYRERIVGEGWSYREIRENARALPGWPDDELRVSGWAPVEEVELEVRPVFGEGDFSHVALRLGLGGCEGLSWGCPGPRRIFDHPEPVVAVGRQGQFLSSRGAHTRIAAMTVTTPAVDVSSIVSIGWGEFAWLEGPDTLAIAASPQRIGEEILIRRETLPGTGPTQLVSLGVDDSAVLIVRGDRLMLGGANVSSGRLLFGIGAEHTLEGVPEDILPVAHTVAYRVGDRVFARERSDLAVSVPIDARLTSGVRRLVAGFAPGVWTYQLRALLGEQLHSVSVSFDTGLGVTSDGQPEPLVVPASELIGVTADGRQLGTRSVASPLENPYGPEHVDLASYFRAPITALALDVFDGINIQGVVAVERGGGSTVYDVGVPYDDACGL